MFRRSVVCAFFFVVACGSKASTTDAGTDDAASDASDASKGDGGITPCTVTPGTSGVLVTGRLLLASGPITGELLIGANGIIACADASCAQTTGYADATRIDCPSSVISPSLINPHDHTDYSSNAPVDHGDTRYAHRNEWRTGADGATPLPNINNTTDPNIIAAGELRFVLGGATAIVGSGGVEGLARNLANYKDQAELQGLTGNVTFFDTFPLGDSNGTVLTSGCAYPSIRSSSEAFEDGNYEPHVAEGINAAAENELHCTMQTGDDLVTSRTAVIHGVGVNATDISAIQKGGASLVWSPRSNISLYGDTASVTDYLAQGVTISLGTDWLPSGSMNVLRELACADSMNQKYFANAFADVDLWKMVTINAAAAAGFDSQIGSLDVGKVADVAVFDASNASDYRAVIAASVEDVHLVLRAGAPLYGDAEIVSALAQNCDALDVCGVARSVCWDVPSSTLAAAQSAIQNIYPLFFCRGQTPTNEPTCTPYRDSYPNGTSATDFDGDGIPDAADDCPKVFNPIRPMDNGMQADVDGDGFGDACDASPLDASSH